jgi:hypothetical protein
VTERTEGDEADEDVVVEAGFAIVPPTGFERVSSDKPSARRASWRRIGFGEKNTKPSSKEFGGIELLTVSRTGTRLDKPTGRVLAKIAETITKSSIPAGATGVQVSARALAGKPGQAQAETYCAHDEGKNRRHSLFRWFTDDDNEVVMVAVGGSYVIPMEKLEEDAAAVVASYRSLVRATKKAPVKKKWWDFFR